SKATPGAGGLFFQREGDRYETLREPAIRRMTTRTLVSDPYVVRRASQQAWVLVLTAGFRWDELPDLQQELVLDLLQRAPQYNPALSEWWAFVRGVMRNQATVL